MSVVVRSGRRAGGPAQRASVRGSDLFGEAIKKVEESSKMRAEISHRAQKEAKSLRADTKGMADSIILYAKTMPSWGADANLAEMMRKIGDFQKWIEEFRNQMSNETYNKIHIPFLEFAQEDIDLLKQERKKLDSESASEGETLSALTTTIRKSDLKSLQKLLEFIHVYHVYFKVGLKKLEDLKTPLEEQKKQIETELAKLEALKKRKATTGGSVVEQPASTERYFGLALTDLLAKEKSKVPRLLQVGFAFLEKNSLATQGIFRIGAVQDDLKYMKEQINAGGNWSFDGASEHTVSGLIKAFFRELPEPLLTFGLFQSFVKANAIDQIDERVAEVKRIIAQLPPANRLVLRALVTLCAKISHNEEVNKMSPNNVAIVITPNILYSKDTSTMTMVEDISSSQNIFVTVIEHYKEIFEPNLLEAALCGDAAVVEQILERGDVNLLEEKDEEGNTTLHRAAEGLHLPVIRLLVEKNIELITIQNSNGKTALDYVSELKGAHYQDVIILLKETTEKFKAKWKKTLLNKTVSERKFSIGDNAAPTATDAPAPIEEKQEEESSDPRFAVQPLLEIATEKPTSKSAFSLITLDEITDTVHTLTLAFASDPVDVSEIQKVVRNVLNVFKNINASCKTYADAVVKEEEKKEILNTALVLQSKMRVLIAAVKSITSTPEDAAAKEAFGDACKQLTEGLHKFVAAAEVTRDRAADNAVQEYEAAANQVLAGIRSYNIENFFKQAVAFANAAVKASNLVPGKIIGVANIRDAARGNSIKNQITQTAEELINTGKSILKKPKSFLDRSGETTTAVEAQLQTLLQTLKEATADQSSSRANDENLQSIPSQLSETTSSLSDSAKEKAGSNLQEISDEVSKLVSQAVESSWLPLLRTSGHLSAKLTQLNTSLAGSVDASQSAIWQESLVYSVVKLKLSVCSRVLAMPSSSRDHLSITTGNTVALLTLILSSF